MNESIEEKLKNDRKGMFTARYIRALPDGDNEHAGINLQKL